MYFTGAKFQSNDLKGRGDIVIFVLLCIGGGKGGAMGLQPHLISECSIGF